MAGIPNTKRAIKDGAKSALGTIKGHRPKGGLLAATIDVGIDTAFRLKQGDPVGPAIMKAIPETLAWTTMPGLMFGLLGVNMLGQAAPALINADSKLESKYAELHKRGRRPSFQMMDTQQAATMRQAAVQAIQGSKLNARNALGGEAALMHRNYNDRMGI